MGKLQRELSVVHETNRARCSINETFEKILQEVRIQLSNGQSVFSASDEFLRGLEK